MVWHITIYVTGERRSRGSKRAPGLMNHRLSTSASSTPKLLDVFSRHERRPVLQVSSINPPGVVGCRRGLVSTHATMEGASGLHLHDDRTSAG
jgi:hypothetical protein